MSYDVQVSGFQMQLTCLICNQVKLSERAGVLSTFATMCCFECECGVECVDLCALGNSDAVLSTWVA